MKSNAIVLAMLLSASLRLSVAPAAAQQRDALVSHGESTFKSQESVRPTAHMPKLELSSEDVQALAAYLASLK